MISSDIENGRIEIGQNFKKFCHYIDDNYVSGWWNSELCEILDAFYDDYLNGQLDTFENRRDSGMRSRSGYVSGVSSIVDDYLDHPQSDDDFAEWQKNILNEKFEAWKGNLEQVDDVLLIGIRV